MSLSSYNRLSAATLFTKTWKSDMLMYGSLAGSICAPSPKPTHPSGQSMANLPLCQFINNPDYINFRSINACFRFDSSLYNNTSIHNRDLLVAAVYESARLAGFQLEHRYKRRNFIEFTCCHNKSPIEKAEWGDDVVQKPGTKVTAAKQQKKHKPKGKMSTDATNNSIRLHGHNLHSIRRTTTKRPTSESTRCKFCFNVIHDDSTKAWYLRENRFAVDPSLHIGHNKLKPHQIKSKLIEMSQEERDLALQCSELFVQNSVISKLMNLRKGQKARFCSKQIAYLRSKLRANKLLHDHSAKNSSAENLINNFQEMQAQGQDIHFIALTHSYKDGYLITNSRGRPKKKVPEGECKFIQCTLALTI